MKFLIPIFSRYGAIIIQFAVVTLVARELSTESAGIYFFVAGLVLSIYFLTGLGMPDGLVAACPPEIAADRPGAARTMLRRGLQLSLPTALILPALLGVLIWVLYGSAKIALLAAIWLLGYCLIFIASQNLIALGRVQWGSFIFYSAINFCLCFTTIPYLSLSNQPDLETTLSVTSSAAVAAGVVSMVFVAFQIRKLGPAEDTPILRSLWLNGFIMSVGRVAQATIIWMPVWLAGLLLTKADTAHIGLACRLLGVVGAVLAAVRFSIRPQIAQLAAEGQWVRIEALDRKIAFWATALALIAMLVVFVAGSTAIPLIFGQDYFAVSFLLLILLWGSVAESLGGPVDEILKMTGDAKVVLYLQMAALFFMAGVGTVLAIRFGVTGICVAFALSFLLLYGGQIVFLYRSRRILALPKPGWIS